MSKFSIYLDLPPYLEQWLRHEFWDAESQRVCFPKQSVASLIMERFIRRWPKDVTPDLAACRSLLPVKIPSFARLNPSAYTYLPPAGERALVGAIKRRFKYMLRRELDGFDPKLVQIQDLVEAFADLHGIERDPRNWETIRQMYYRMRKADSPSAPDDGGEL